MNVTRKRKLTGSDGPVGKREKTDPHLSRTSYFDPKDTATPVPIGLKRPVVCTWVCPQSGDQEQRLVTIADRKKDAGRWVYYVRYDGLDSRMDEWVPRERLSFPEKTKNVVKGEEEDHDDDHVHRVRQIDSIVLGGYKMPTWYFSPFPVEYTKFKTLHFCDFCLQFFGYTHELQRHAQKCVLRHPPGNEIYRSKENNIEIAVFEVDGAKEVTYCENLSYVGKAFLDHKNLWYDTEAFLFYPVTEVKPDGCHLLSFFSKEKHSEMGYNLACIMTLPCHQKKGVGTFMISLSYELSKLEKKIGTPERPLSDLGEVSYRRYWAKKIVAALERKREMSQRMGGENDEISIQELSATTSIREQDISDTLIELGIIKYCRGEYIFALPENYLQTHYGKKDRPADSVYVGPCESAKLHWTPFYAHRWIQSRR